MPRPAPTNVAIHELLSKRWSPRAFSNDGVSRLQLERLFEAARWSASSFNDQPWAFVVANRENQTGFADLLSLLVEFNQGWAKSAGALCVGIARTKFAHNQQPNRHAYYDLGQAVAQLAVQATAEGLVIHQMAGFDAEKARSTLQLPEGWDPVVVFAIGVEGDPQSLTEPMRSRELSPRSRKPIESFVFANRWGIPLQ